MKIIICGAGRVGFYLAKYLSQEDHDIVVVDRDLDLIANINDKLDVRAVPGAASFPEVLDSGAGASDADMIIAVTRNDEMNMVICQVAHSLFQVPIKIARIRNREYLSDRWNSLFSPNNIPIDTVIFPELEVAKSIAKRLYAYGSFDLETLVDDTVAVVGVRCSHKSSLLRVPLRNMSLSHFEMSVMAIVRNGRLFFPSGHDEIIENDEVYVVLSKDHINDCLKEFGFEPIEDKKGIIIVGAGEVAIHLAEILYDTGNFSIKIIEKNKERAKEVAYRLPHISILSGDGLEDEILREAGIDDAHTVVSVTGDDETNVLTALLAKKYDVERTIALVDREVYSPLISSFNIDSIISPRAITASSILEHVRRGNVGEVYSVRDGIAEIFEMEITSTSSVIGSSPKSIQLPKGAHIAALVRGEKVVFDKNVEIREDDRIIIIALREAIKQVESTFAIRNRF